MTFNLNDKIQAHTPDGQRLTFDLPFIGNVTSQKCGAYISQFGNAVMLLNALIAGDTRSFLSTLPAITADSIFSWPRKKDKVFGTGELTKEEKYQEENKDRKWEAACYSGGAAVVTGLLLLFRTSAVVATNPKFKDALVWQTITWGVGVMRYPLEYIVAPYLKNHMPRVAEFVRRTGRVTPALVTVAALMIRYPLVKSLGLFDPKIQTIPDHNVLKFIFFSKEGNAFRLLAAQGIFCAADIFKGAIVDAFRDIGKWGREDRKPPDRPTSPQDEVLSSVAVAEVNGNLKARPLVRAAAAGSSSAPRY